MLKTVSYKKSSCYQFLGKVKKVKPSICIACFRNHLKCAQTWITQFYLQTTPCLPLSRKCSPDGASTDGGGKHLIAAYYSFIDPEMMKGWVGLVVWPIVDGLPVYPHKRSPVSYRSSAGQRRHASQRPTFYRWAMQLSFGLGTWRSWWSS